MTTFRNALLIVVIAALTLTLVPSADAAKPAKLGDRAGLKLIMDLAAIEKRRGATSKRHPTAKTLRAQQRLLVRASRTLRAGKCQRELRVIAGLAGKAAVVTERHGAGSAQQRKALKPAGERVVRLGTVCG